MAVHVNRHITDNQYISAIGIVHDKTGTPFLLAETFNPTVIANLENPPPALLIALPDSVDKAYHIGRQVATSYQLEGNIKNSARNKGNLKINELAKYLGIDSESASKNEIYGNQQVNTNSVEQRALFVSGMNENFVTTILGKPAEGEEIGTPNQALEKINGLIASGRQGHFFKMRGFIASGPSTDQNVFDGYTVDFPDPEDPTKTYPRQVITGTAIALEPVFSPRQAIGHAENKIKTQNEAINRGFGVVMEDGIDITHAEKVVFATQRVMMSDTTLVSAEDIHSPNVEFETNEALASQIDVKKTTFARTHLSGYASVSSDVVVKNEVPLALSKIPTVTDHDPKLRQQGIHQFHRELGKAISEYHSMHENREHAKDLLGLNTGLVLDVWSKSPEDASKDGVKNGYKTRQGFGMYVDLQDKSVGARTADGRTQSIMDQLNDIVNLRDKATLDYLGERQERKGGKPPTFNYRTSTHKKLANHLNDLIKAETGAIKIALDDYVNKISEGEKNLPENMQIVEILDGLKSDDPEDNNNAALNINKFAKDHPLIAEKILDEAKLEATTKYDIQRTANAMLDIEKKYAANTGLRSIFLAGREGDVGPIILNPDDPKFGKIHPPEWFHKGKSGMSNSYFEKELLPKKQLTTRVVDNENFLDKVTVINLPRAASVYGELIKDMADIRLDEAQTPELQKNRILTHPTFQIATVKRWSANDTAGFEKWYNSKERKEDKTNDSAQVMRYNDYLTQIQPSLVGKASSSLAKMQQTKTQYEKAGLSGSAYKYGTVESLGTAASSRLGEVVERRDKEGKVVKEFDARLLSRTERIYASNFGQSYTSPIAAYKPHLLAKDGASMSPIDPNVGSFQTLEGTYPPAIGKTIRINFNPKSQHLIKGIDRTDYISYPVAQPLNPLNDLGDFNKHLEKSSASFRKMVELQTPGLEQLGNLGVSAYIPIAHLSNIQYSFFQMQKDKNDISNSTMPARSHDYGIERDGVSSVGYTDYYKNTKDAQYDAKKVENRALKPSDDQLAIAERMENASFDFSVPMLDIETGKTTNVPDNTVQTKGREVKQPAYNDGPELGM